MQIAIDTSTDIASIAIVEADSLIAEMTWRCGPNHSVQLMPGLDSLLRRAGLKPESAGGVIVALGPGSYNGLRVGLSAAKGLSFALGVPLVGISTLEAEAYQHAGRGLPVCAISNAGRGEVAAAIYLGQEDSWSQVLSEHITTVEELCVHISGTTVFCGAHLPAVRDRIKSLLGQKAVIISGAANVRRAGYLAELGARRLKAGDHDDPATLQPLYLRAPQITAPKEK